MPYCTPSTWYMPTAASLRSPIHGSTSAEMSRTNPASTCSMRPPPPHDWKRSGGSPACRRGAIAVLNASFSYTVMSIVTFGCSAMYSSATSCQSDSPGSLF